MKILFTSEAVVEICDGRYHKTSFNPFIERYRYFGDVIFASYKREVAKSSQSVLNTSGVQFEFFLKENSLKGFTNGKRINDCHMARCVEQVDIVVAHLPSPIGMHAIKHAKRMNKPYFIAVVGCTWDALWNYNWKGKLMALPSFLSMRRVISKAPFVLYVTQSFLQRRYPCHGITVGCSNVEIGDMSQSVLNRRLLKIERFDTGQKVNIATVAAVNVRYKGQEFVIKAISILNHKLGFKYHYYLIGGGDNSYLMSLTRKLNLEEYVHFLGPKPHEEIWDYLDKMDLYIQPSKQEGLPRALVEAMSRALPAFGSRTAGIPELLLEECLFDNGDVKGIVKLLSSLSIDKVREYANVNFKKASEYTSDVLSKRRKNFFDEVLASIG